MHLYVNETNYILSFKNIFTTNNTNCKYGARWFNKICGKIKCTLYKRNLRTNYFFSLNIRLEQNYTKKKKKSKCK